MSDAPARSSQPQPDTAAFSWIRNLERSDDLPEIQPASSDTQRARLLALVGHEPLGWAVELGQRVAAQITRDIPAYARNRAGFEYLRTGTESTTLQLLSVLAGDAHDGAATTDSFAAVTDAVQRRISLDELLRGIQLGHGVMASDFLAACSRLSDPSATLAGMRALSERMFEFFDLFVTEMSTYYHAERARWEGSPTAVRLTVVHRILEGGAAEPGWEAKLGYGLDGQHVAIVAVSPAPETDAVHAAVTEGFAAVGCADRVVLVAAPGVVWAWGRSAAVSGVVAALNDAELPSGSVAVVSGAALGREGFARSHREALAGVALAERMGRGGEAIDYSELDLISLILADSERAQAFAAKELGALDSSTQQARELRRTLAAFIDERGSPHAAAQRISVSRNTVSYRVQRAEELLGRSANVRRLHLRCALLIREIDDAIGDATVDASALQQRTSKLR